MERRFVKYRVSMHIVASYGKDFAQALMDSLPKETEIIKQETDVDTGSMFMLAYNKEFDKLEDNEIPPMLVCPIKEKPSSIIQTFQ